MAEPVASTEATWSASRASIGEILNAVETLRAEQGAVTRTSIVTLVVTAQSTGEAERAQEIISQMGARNPTRSLIVITEPDADNEPSSIDAHVRLRGRRVEEDALWSDTIVLTVKGPVVHHLDSIIEPFTLPDLPVVLWFMAAAPDTHDPLLESADAIVVDTKELGARMALAAVAELCERHTVVDLSWVRLKPWRELLAGLFEGETFRPFISGIENAQVTGKSAPRRLLGGWLLSRLGLDISRLNAVDERHAAVRLMGTAGGRRGYFAVERQDGERLVRASVTISGGQQHEEVLALPDDALPWSLAEAITHLEPNVVYAQAIEASLEID